MQSYEVPEIILIADPSCPDDSTGIVSVQVIGGEGPFDYSWNVTNENTEILQGV